MTFNLGGFADGLSKIGKNMMESVTFYGTAKMALHNPDRGYYGGSIWMQQGGYPTGCMGGYMGGYMGGAYSPYNAAAINMAYQQGYASTMAAIQSSILGSQMPVNLPATDAPTASAVDSNQNTTAGAMFEKAEAEGQNFDFAKTAMSGETDNAKKSELYRNALEDIGKSLLMNIDKNAGNSDGFINLEEFINNELKGHPQLDNNTKAQIKARLQQAFNQLDMNGDKKADWKEFSSLIAMYDKNGDGEITPEEFKTSGQQLYQGHASQELRNAYSKFFGNLNQ